MPKDKKEKPNESFVPSPLLRDTGKIAKVVGDQFIGAANIAGYGVASGVDYLTGSNLSEAVAPGVEKAFGITPISRSNQPLSRSNQPPVNLIAEPASAQIKGQPVKDEFNPDKYNNIYEAVKDMPDEGFIRFIQKHGDQVPGLGYTKDSKGKVYRTIEPPKEEQQGRGIGDMSIREAEIAEKLIGHRAINEHNQEVLRQNVLDRADKNDLKQQGIFVNQLKVNSPKDMEGNYDERVGLFRMAIGGAPIHNSYKLAAKQLVDDFEKDYRRSLAEAKLKDSPELRKRAQMKYQGLMANQTK